MFELFRTPKFKMAVMHRGLVHFSLLDESWISSRAFGIEPKAPTFPCLFIRA